MEVKRTDLLHHPVGLAVHVGRDAIEQGEGWRGKRIEPAHGHKIKRRRNHNLWRDYALIFDPRDRSVG